jgi:aarF domain-containing kinase
MPEYARVLKGLSMVLEQAARRNGPEMQKRGERIIYHVSEILKMIQEVNKSNSSSRAGESSDTATIFKDEFKYPNATQSGNQQPSSSAPRSNQYTQFKSEHVPKQDIDLIGFDSLSNTDTESIPLSELTQDGSSGKSMRERSVPSTQIGRVVGFGSLAIRMAMGEAVSRVSHTLSGQSGPRVISDENAERLAESLCRMRGAALKLGQMLSIQDEASLPPSIARALERVKQTADYMPKKQLEQQLTSQLGHNWREKFLEFDPVPIAAASIGQVHQAKLLDGTEVAVKIQYPGVAESIDSDLQNLKSLVNMTNLLPPGLFVDNIIKVASTELVAECKSLSTSSIL